ncbi:hypothetical protein [Staphylococcus delphini]|uniref:Phage protein n=1 Tax=Staphylococcus delphini TaxID=53344 RepID=A0AAX0QSY4_9STAP|nr:hypothetical protein [Staphylococcus delphini]PCF50080.1 hypothetical protein B5C07_07685 [Staphylococcus delphini]PNZ95701.1 hypothetical protein CD148_03225 [Staphylococcus delphini]RIZ56288.1 hypothetical protein CDL68_01740 [Staphylococcus delphini]VED62524.1 Uncharacterised protein [Staphylococcus delphini]
MENKNDYKITMPSFYVLLERDEEEYVIKNIVMNKNGNNLLEKSLDADDTNIILFELIESRLAAEKVISDTVTKSEQLKNENEYLLDKINTLESSLDEIRDGVKEVE